MMKKKRISQYLIVTILLLSFLVTIPAKEVKAGFPSGNWFYPDHVEWSGTEVTDPDYCLIEDDNEVRMDSGTVWQAALIVDLGELVEDVTAIGWETHCGAYEVTFHVFVTANATPFLGGQMAYHDEWIYLGCEHPYYNDGDYATYLGNFTNDVRYIGVYKTSATHLDLDFIQYEVGTTYKTYITGTGNLMYYSRDFVNVTGPYGTFGLGGFIPDTIGYNPYANLTGVKAAGLQVRFAEQYYMSGDNTTLSVQWNVQGGAGRYCYMYVKGSIEDEWRQVGTLDNHLDAFNGVWTETITGYVEYAYFLSLKGGVPEDAAGIGLSYLWNPAVPEPSEFFLNEVAILAFLLLLGLALIFGSWIALKYYWSNGDVATGLGAWIAMEMVGWGFVIAFLGSY